MPETFYPVESFGGTKRVTLRFEADVYECEVIGEIPKELNGTLYRTGGNREYSTLEGDNIINGDGLFSMFRFSDGHVSFKSRYVKTERLLAERKARKRLIGSYRNKYTDDPSISNLKDRDNTANTYAYYHHGKLYALREDSHPYMIDPDTLETLEIDHFEGKIKSTSLTAHPKIDPITGEWWSIGLFASGEPYKDMSLHVFDKDGQLIREEIFDLPYSGIAHDWAITREHIIFPILPLIVDMDRVKNGGSFYAFDPDLPSKWGIMPRNGKVSQIRWIDIPNITMGHVMNAYSEGNLVHVDVTLTAGNIYSFFPTIKGETTDPIKAATTITRITFDLDKPDGEAVSFKPINGALGDMPRFDERLAMSKYRYGYFALRKPPEFGVGMIDWESGELKVHQTNNAFAQEPLFVPRTDNGEEGDGFVLSLINIPDENTASLLVLDGRDISKPAIATIKLPFNLPFSFHGCFVKA